MAHLRYHDTYDKQIGCIRVRSYGGGHPRWVEILEDDHEALKLTVEQVRDLQYALTRFLEEFD